VDIAPAAPAASHHVDNLEVGQQTVAGIEIKHKQRMLVKIIEKSLLQAAAATPPHPPTHPPPHDTFGSWPTSNAGRKLLTADTA
jgi:hypothetical protein